MFGNKSIKAYESNQFRVETLYMPHDFRRLCIALPPFPVDIKASSPFVISDYHRAPTQTLLQSKILIYTL
jgi:hypothetical protein